MAGDFGWQHDTIRRSRSKEQPATKVEGGQPPVVQEDSVPTAHDPAFFEKVKTRIAKQSKDDRNVLLNIPVWGWTGDGKTCALLTMLHYGAAPQHALSLAYVTDQDEFTKVESEVDAYQGLNLNPLAASTKARLSELNESFIDNATWPPGTDEPTSYVFAVRAINSTLGYLVIPDLQGGSFREVDDVARTVLANAHACVILVQPERYTNAGADGKRYRDEVMSRLTKCAEAGIAACVMITKSDLHAAPGSIADQIHNELTVLIDSHTDLEAEIFRVSVIGLAAPLAAAPMATTDESEEVSLPPPRDRHPDQLIRAFVWVIDRALERPTAEIRHRVPDLTFHRAREDAQPSREPIAEFRKLGEFSDRPGIALCGVSADSFLFIAPDGSLIRATFRDGEFATQNAGSIADVGTPTNKFVAFHVSGELLVAASQRTDVVWVGPIGSRLSRTPLPSAVVSWAPVTSRSLIALDANGRLHSVQEREVGEAHVSLATVVYRTHSAARSSSIALNGCARICALPSYTRTSRQRWPLSRECTSSVFAIGSISQTCETPMCGVDRELLGAIDSFGGLRRGSPALARRSPRRAGRSR